MEVRCPHDRIEKDKLIAQFLVFTIICALVTTLGCRSKDQPHVSAFPLTPEQVRVYSDFSDEFSALHFGRLANQTAPFVPSDLPDESACVQGLDLEGQAKARKVLHRFTVQITNGRNLLLVDPNEQAVILEQKEAVLNSKADTTKEDTAKIGGSIASDYGFLALSEIIFDKKHQFAVLKYWYFCGYHCKPGGTLLMEKVESSWTMIIN